MSLRRNRPTPIRTFRDSPAVTIRHATLADTAPLEILAKLDEAEIPAPPLLLGLVGDELWVAVSLCTEEVIADPFRRSGEVASLVLQRARQLTVHEQRAVRGGSWQSLDGPTVVALTPRPLRSVARKRAEGRRR